MAEDKDHLLMEVKDHLLMVGIAMEDHHKGVDTTHPTKITDVATKDNTQTVLHQVDTVGITRSLRSARISRIDTSKGALTRAPRLEGTATTAAVAAATEVEAAVDIILDSSSSSVEAINDMGVTSNKATLVLPATNSATTTTRGNFATEKRTKLRDGFVSGQFRLRTIDKGGKLFGLFEGVKWCLHSIWLYR